MYAGNGPAAAGVQAQRNLYGPSLAEARVLVVDDDAQIRQLLGQFLADEGCEVQLAPDGAHALRVARSWRPDAIVLDLMMPVMNGWQFVEAYGDEPGWHAPIVVITAAGPGAIRSAQSLGRTSAVVSKPFDLDELALVISMQLNGGAGGAGGSGDVSAPA